LKYLIYIFYGSIVLTGGIRNYSEELSLHEACLNLNISPIVKDFLIIFEYSLHFLALFILVFPFKKWFHFAFGTITFLVDLFFQNFVFIEKYIILVNFFPFILFVFLYYNSNKEKLFGTQVTIIKLVAIGYITAFLGKVAGGWLITNEPVVYSYILMGKIEMTKGFEVPTIINWFNRIYIYIDSLFFHKMVDYIVLIFQFSAILLFWKPNYFKWFSVFAVIFHLCIMLLFGGYLFYTYILLYTLIIMNTERLISIRNNTIEKTGVRLVVFIYFCGFVYNDFDRFYLNENNYVYIYTGPLLTLLSALIFIMYWYNRFFKSNNKSN